MEEGSFKITRVLRKDNYKNASFVVPTIFKSWLV